MSTQKDISCGPTWRGRIETTEDALIVFGACFTGYLHYCLRRPKEAEWPQLIVSGNVFVYDEAVSGIKRWTDGKSWSPSRALGDFLLYRQVSEPGRKKAKPGGRKHRTNTDGKPNRFLVGSLVDSYDFQGDGLIKKTISIELLDIHHRVTHHHLVSYYTLNDADYLTTPKYDRFLKDCCIREALFDQLPFEYCFGTWTKKLGVNPSSSPNGKLPF